MWVLILMFICAENLHSHIHTAMAPSLPSCISSTFCSHRQASWILLATLSPLFLPFLVLSVPFLLLFLAPLSCFLFSLLLLYKLQVFLRWKCVRSPRHADKAVLSEGYQETQQIAAAEWLDVPHQAPLEQDIGGRRYGVFPAFEGLECSNAQSAESHPDHKEGDTQGSNVQSAELHVHRKEGDTEGLLITPSSDKDLEEEKREDLEKELAAQEVRQRCGVFPVFEGLEGSNVQSAELHAHHKEGDKEGSNVQSAESHAHHKGGTEGLCIPPASVKDFEEEKRQDIEEELAAQDGTTEDKIEEKREEQDIIESPFLKEHRERIGGDFPEDEGPEVSNVPSVESLASYQAAGLEEGLRAPVSNSPERESIFTEETREDMGEELLRIDMMQDNKQEEKDTTEEAIDEQKHFPLCLDATSSCTLTSLSPTYEHESLDRQSSVPFERQGQESLEDRSEMLESSHMHPLEEAWRKLPAIQSAEPNFQAEMAFPSQIVEKPREDTLNERLEIDTPFTEVETQGCIGEEPERSSEMESSLENLGYKGLSDQKKDVFFPAESFERETEGEPSCHSREGHGQWREEAFAKETRDDVQPQEGTPATNLAESRAEREEGYPSEAPSSAVPPPHVSHGGIEFQDRIQEEQKIMADINAIKKIVGYESEPHASIMDQISALYMFLGMEPYYWAAEVDEFERAQTEIELLKVVVGVK